MLPAFYQFQVSTKVLYGPGLALDFSHELQELGAGAYFLVTDRVIHELGLANRVGAQLKKDGYTITGIYMDVPQDASVACVEAIAEQCRRTGAEAILAIGGGSVIDAAKAANFIFTNGGRLIEDYSGAATLSSPLKPLVVIPTTAGTGSECTLAAVIYDQTNHVKLSFSDKFLLPNLAVLDPQMTVTMPPLLTASTGMDALTHAVEAFMGIDASPHSQALGQFAISCIYNNIVRAVENGDDVEARGAMLIGANLAGISFSHSMVGCVHSMAHGTGAVARVPHGTANAILLPHGMAYNFEESKNLLAAMAPFLGEHSNGLDADDAAQRAIDAVKKLTAKLNRLCSLPVRLRDAGVKEEMLPLIAQKAEEDGTAIYNPRPVIAEEIMVPLTNAF
jgi:alcohol dehydrogenase